MTPELREEADRLWAALDALDEDPNATKEDIDRVSREIDDLRDRVQAAHGPVKVRRKEGDQ